jgi:FkbM family methyltransferase
MNSDSLRKEVASLMAGGWEAAYADRVAEIRARIGARDKVLLFGSGYLGTHAHADLAESGLEVVAFVDNDPDRWGKEIDGLRVYSPAEAQEKYGDGPLWLITIYTNSEVIRQCRSLGVPWVTCAELSWAVEIGTPSFDFGKPADFLSAAPSIEAAAAIWGDDESTNEYLAQVKWRLTLDYGVLAPPRPSSETYFPPELFHPLPDESFVDCGAFTGDTIDGFIQASDGRFASIVAVEPDPVNAASLRGRASEWTRDGIGPVLVEECAAGAQSQVLSFTTTGTAGSCVGTGQDSVQVFLLDDILADRDPTFIKFDVEGAEQDALLGARETLGKHMPFLAVCLYHRPEDVWALPLLIQSMNPQYDFYLRRYSDERWETVCYAVPPERASR